MDRKEIKAQAKEKIKGNKWNIWWPLLIISFVESVIEQLFIPAVNINNIDSVANIKINFGSSFGFAVVGILFGVITAGYIKYIINFVRTGKFNTNDIIDTIKSKWLNILIANILVSIIVGIGMVLCVVPGIILSLAYTLVTYLVVDTDIAGHEALAKSRELMKGHKWELFVFMLSFIGWCFLVPFTLGILCIWLVPYFMVALIIYYDSIAKDSSSKKAKN